jgi:hypothetical protein
MTSSYDYSEKCCIRINKEYIKKNTTNREGNERKEENTCSGGGK